MIEISSKDLRYVYQFEETLSFGYENGTIIKITFPSISKAQRVFRGFWFTTDKKAYSWGDIVNVEVFSIP
jgi:hypothetical protein